MSRYKDPPYTTVTIKACAVIEKDVLNDLNNQIDQVQKLKLLSPKHALPHLDDLLDIKQHMMEEFKHSADSRQRYIDEMEESMKKQEKLLQHFNEIKQSIKKMSILKEEETRKGEQHLEKIVASQQAILDSFAVERGRVVSTEFAPERSEDEQEGERKKSSRDRNSTTQQQSILDGIKAERGSAVQTGMGGPSIACARPNEVQEERERGPEAAPLG